MDTGNPQEQEIEVILREVPTMLEQLNQGYNKFFTGTERVPPVQLREKLEKRIERLRTLIRSTQNSVLRFKSQNTIAHYTSYRSMWDKRLAERERTR